MGAGRKLGRVRRLVVKVGSGLVTEAGAGVAPDRVEALSAEIATVREGRRVVLVTSGAIATGVARLGLAERPRSIPEKQAAAAVGQSALMWQYEAAFSRHRIPVGQVLLTAEDVRDRARYLRPQHARRPPSIRRPANRERERHGRGGRDQGRRQRQPQCARRLAGRR